ncbi:hypothetical protein [Streptomyces werraensis]|uniref:hypothetical protein n=1 Tax=Streptomyces werraensis TaxID=68284 RepID=UPI001CE32655
MSLYDPEVCAAVRPLKAHLVADPIQLPDGRKVRGSAYPDGSIRFCMDGLPWVLTEVYLSGNPQKGKEIVKLSPGEQGSSNAAYKTTSKSRRRGTAAEERCEMPGLVR